MASNSSPSKQYIRTPQKSLVYGMSRITHNIRCKEEKLSVKSYVLLANCTSWLLYAPYTTLKCTAGTFDPLIQNTVYYIQHV